METASFKPNSALREIHSELMIKLINEIITNNRGANSFTAWKEAFEAQISELPAHQECSVYDNFNFMKMRGLLGVGKYQNLRKLLKGNEYALSAIDETLQKMEKELEKSGYDPSMLNAKEMTAEFQVEVTNGVVNLVKKLIDVLNDMVISIKEKFYTLSWIETCLKIVKREETTTRYEEICGKLDEAKQGLRKIFKNHGNDAENKSTSILIEFFSLLSSMDKTFKIEEIKFQDQKGYIVIFGNANAFDRDYEELDQKITRSFEKMLDYLNKRPKCEEKERSVY